MIEEDLCGSFPTLNSSLNESTRRAHVSSLLLVSVPVDVPDRP